MGCSPKERVAPIVRVIPLLLGSHCEVEARALARPGEVEDTRVEDLPQGHQALIFPGVCLQREEVCGCDPVDLSVGHSAHCCAPRHQHQEAQWHASCKRHTGRVGAAGPGEQWELLWTKAGLRAKFWPPKRHSASRIPAYLMGNFSTQVFPVTPWPACSQVKVREKMTGNQHWTGERTCSIMVPHSHTCACMHTTHTCVHMLKLRRR